MTDVHIIMLSFDMTLISIIKSEIVSHRTARCIDYPYKNKIDKYKESVIKNVALQFLLLLITTIAEMFVGIIKCGDANARIPIYTPINFCLFIIITLCFVRILYLCRKQHYEFKDWLAYEEQQNEKYGLK